MNVKIRPAVVLSTLAVLAAPLHAADLYWSGGGALSDNIDQTDNWYGGVNPSSGDNLYFDNTITRHFPYSNYGAGS